MKIFLTIIILLLFLDLLKLFLEWFAPTIPDRIAKIADERRKWVEEDLFLRDNFKKNL